MTRTSIRGRLAAWYLLVLLIATSAFAVVSSALLHRSIRHTADATLRTRTDDVRTFIGRASVALPHAEFLDEFSEYAQLTPGDALLEVRDDTGVVYCRPMIDNWYAVSTRVSVPTEERAPVFSEVALHGDPFRTSTAAVRVGQRVFLIIAATPMRPALDAAATFGWLLVGLVPAVVIAGGIGGYLISRRALAPLDRFSDAIEAITLDHLDRRIEVPAADVEVQRLAATFNRTMARLETAVGEMARLTTEASHELRMPVALIRTTAELAVSQPRSADDYRLALTDVLAQAERLSGLVHDLLTLARVDAGIEPADRQAVDIARLVEACHRSLQPALAERRLHSDVDAADRPVVQGSPGALERVLMVLFDNAMKYTPPGGSLRVAIRAERARPETGEGPDGVAIDVLDSGTGIDPAERSRVFDRFYRGAAARAAVPDGSGLGLYIARAILERHGGTIALGPGIGGAGLGVRVWLPL